MGRKTYNCGGKGRYGTPPGPCTICGKRHPKGKRKANWSGCTPLALRKDAPSFMSANTQKTKSKTNKGIAQQKKEIKRQEAQNRNMAWQKLSLEQQLAELDTRPGNCKKQRAKITKKLEKQ